MILGTDVNLWAVLVVGVASLILGSLWYGPLFGKAWIKLMGITPKMMKDAQKKGMAKKYLLAFIGSLVMAYVLGVFIELAGATTILRGAMIGFIAWAGFFVTKGLSSFLWEGKSFKLYLINTFYDLVLLLIAGAVLVAFG